MNRPGIQNFAPEGFFFAPRERFSDFLEVGKFFSGTKAAFQTLFLVGVHTPHINFAPRAHRSGRLLE